MDFNCVIGYYARFLRFLFVLPTNYGSRLIEFPLFALIIFLSVSNWTMFLVNLLKQDVPSIDNICEAVVSSGINLRYYLVLTKRRCYMELLNDCRDVWQSIRSNEYGQVFYFERKIRKVFLFIVFSTTAINVFYSVQALIIDYNRKRENSTDEWHRTLPYKYYVDDAEAYWPGYEATFAFQFLILVFISVLTSTIDTSVPLLMMINSGYLRVLQDRFYACEEVDGLRGDDFVVSCVKLHQKILDTCEKIKSFSRTLFLVQLFCTGYNTSLIMVKMVSTDPDRYKYFSLLSLSLGQMFVCNYASEFLINESEAVAVAAYSASIGWMRSRFGRLFTIIIARSQTPVQMTAGGILDLSLERFGTMLTSAVSFFTVLRNFNG